MLAVQQQRAHQLAETEKKVKEILARRGEGEYDPDQQVVSYNGYTATEKKKLDKMTKDELITIAKGHIKNARSLKKPELLKQIRQFMELNPGKILFGTEVALVQENNAGEEVPLGELEEGEEMGLMEESEGLAEKGGGGSLEIALAQEDKAEEEEGPSAELGVGARMGLMRESAVHPYLAEEGGRGSDVYKNINIEKTCSILECDGTNIEELVWCDECELWFCEDLHGPHSSHSAQTHFKEGRFPKKSEYVSVDVVAEPPASQDAYGTSKKRKNGGLDMSIQTTQKNEMSRLGVVTRKLRDILAKPSKHQKDQLRSTLNFSSYDNEFLTMVAIEFGIDISIIAKKNRISRIEVLDYLLSMLN